MTDSSPPPTLSDHSTAHKISATVAPSAIEAWAADIACPVCGNVGFRVEERHVAKPIGGYSLAGAQMKFSTVLTPFIVCGLTAEVGCGVESQGRRD